MVSTDGPDLSPAAPHPADRAKSGASHFLALIFLLVIPATDVEGHGPDPCANAEAAALALALRAVTRDDPESAEVLLDRWEALSARCKSLTEPDPDPIPDVEGHDADPEYDASLLRGQRKACRQGKWEVIELVDLPEGRELKKSLPVAFFHVFLEDVYLLMMRLCGPLDIPLDDPEGYASEMVEASEADEMLLRVEAALIRKQRKACEKELANWTPGAFARRAILRLKGHDMANPAGNSYWPWSGPDAQAQFSGSITASILNKTYSVVVSLCAPLTPVARDMMDDES